jgi:hypothetical protein
MNAKRYNASLPVYSIQKLPALVKAAETGHRPLLFKSPGKDQETIRIENDQN